MKIVSSTRANRISSLVSLIERTDLGNDSLRARI